MKKKYTFFDISKLMDEVFHATRTPRSQQYRHGVQVILHNRLMGERILAPPYPVGSCETDAYFAGQAEGRDIVAGLREQEAHRDRNRA